MNRLICFFSILVLAAGAVGVASSVQADMISGPFTTSTPIPYTLTDWIGSLLFPMFNSGLGTLTEVDMTLTGAMQTTLTVTNSSPDPSSGSANTEVRMSVQDAGSNFSPRRSIFSRRPLAILWRVAAAWDRGCSPRRLQTAKCTPSPPYWLSLMVLAPLCCLPRHLLKHSSPTRAETRRLRR